jgi:hypothetical protein
MAPLRSSSRWRGSPIRGARLCFADRLLALIEQHSQPRAASVLIGFQAATDGYLPYWRVLALPSLTEVSRPPADPDALPDIALTAEQEAALARISREREQRLSTLSADRMTPMLG